MTPTPTITRPSLYAGARLHHCVTPTPTITRSLSTQARECITAAASFPTLSRLNHPDSQATRRDLRCAVDAAALLAHVSGGP